MSNYEHPLTSDNTEWCLTASTVKLHFAILSGFDRVLTGSEAQNEWVTRSEFSSLVRCQIPVPRGGTTSLLTLGRRYNVHATIFFADP